MRNDPNVGCVVSFMWSAIQGRYGIAGWWGVRWRSTIRQPQNGWWHNSREISVGKWIHDGKYHWGSFATGRCQLTTKCQALLPSIRTRCVTNTCEKINIRNPSAATYQHFQHHVRNFYELFTAFHCHGRSVAAPCQQGAALEPPVPVLSSSRRGLCGSSIPHRSLFWYVHNGMIVGGYP